MTRLRKYEKSEGKSKVDVLHLLSENLHQYRDEIKNNQGDKFEKITISIVQREVIREVQMWLLDALNEAYMEESYEIIPNKKQFTGGEQ